ncbi:hypothetical protein LZ30DRAFT_743765 [Colletotrichum cereale]|nr:hypothetical protein LZ30DRAFT_743765 [Colletotrichum cereale]
MRTEKIGLQDFLFSRRVPGIRSPPRTTQSPGHTERAQSSRQGNQVHRTDRDPWATRDRVATQTKLNIGGRL